MNFLITMAGDGARFRDAGYSDAKWALAAHGKTMLEWSVDSLPLESCANLVFVVRDRDADRARSLVEKRYGSLSPKYVVVDAPTGGQAGSVLAAASTLDTDLETAIFNIDTRFTSRMLREKLSSGESDGVIGAFKSTHPWFSYARTSGESVVEVAEKRAISDNALTGFYHFRDTAGMLEETEKMVSSGERVNGEFYIAPVYQRMIVRGRKFSLDFVDSVDILGTPREYESFLSRPVEQVEGL